MDCQKQIQLDPLNTTLIGEESELAKTYHRLKQASELFLRQKTKIQWLTQGDQNTKVFHSFMKARRNENRIFFINEAGVQSLTNNEKFAHTFVDFYTKLLGTTRESGAHVCSNLVRVGSIVNEEQRAMLEADFTNADIKQTLWGIDGEKALGLDRYGRNFLRDCWGIVRKDLSDGVLEFFVIGKMLRALNNTVIIIIPETKHTDTVGYYLPIACCNTIYKIIAKCYATDSSKICEP